MHADNAAFMQIGHGDRCPQDVNSKRNKGMMLKQSKLPHELLDPSLLSSEKRERERDKTDYHADIFKTKH